MAKLHVIYLPGLGDHNAGLQSRLIALWRIWGVQPRYHLIWWRDRQESFETKLQKLTAMIDELATTGSVSLVGVSAGASMAIHALAERPNKVQRVVTICGKLQHPETVGESRFEQNPPFRGAMARLHQTYKVLNPQMRQRILTIRPLYDDIVPVKDMTIEGAPQRRLPAIFHAISIGVAITLYAPILIRWLKKQVQ